VQKNGSVRASRCHLKKEKRKGRKEEEKRIGADGMTEGKKVVFIIYIYI